MSSLVEKPDYDNVMKRRQNVERTYTYEELCEKIKRVGKDNLDIGQYIAYKRKEGWTGIEPEEKSYYDLLTNEEFYIHCRRFLSDCICLSCSKCPVQGFESRLSGINNECFFNLTEEEKKKIKIVKSPEKQFDLVNQCPLYIKDSDKRIYYDYVHSPLWREIRNIFIEQHPFCEGCGRAPDEVGLVVHHKTYKHLGFEDEYGDCTVLCGQCHDELHKDPESYWNKYCVIIPAHKRKEET